MDEKDYLKYCRVYKGEENNPYHSSAPEERYMPVYWLYERAGVNECISNKLTSYGECVCAIEECVKNGIAMYNDDWARGLYFSHKSLEIFEQYQEISLNG